MRPLPQKEATATTAATTATTISTVPKSTGLESDPCGAASAAAPWPPAVRCSIPTRSGLVFFTVLVFAVGIYVVVRLVMPELSEPFVEVRLVRSRGSGTLPGEALTDQSIGRRTPAIRRRGASPTQGA